MSRLVSEVESLEKSIVASRAAVAFSDAADCRATTERAALIASMKGQAEHAEAAAAVETASIVEATAELKSLARVVEFAFRAIGADAAVDPFLHAAEAAALQVEDRTTATQQLQDSQMLPLAGAAAAAAAMATPARSRAGSLAMFASSPGVGQDVATGVLVGTLGRFVGILETRAADVMHAYAASCAAASDVAVIAAHAAAAAAEEENVRSSTAQYSPNGSQVIGVSVGALNAVGTSTAGAGIETARRLSATASAAATAIGPTHPTGLLREAFAASTLVASLIDTATARPTTTGIQASDVTALEESVGTVAGSRGGSGEIWHMGIVTVLLRWKRVMSCGLAYLPR